MDLESLYFAAVLVVMMGDMIGVDEKVDPEFAELYAVCVMFLLHMERFMKK